MVLLATILDVGAAGAETAGSPTLEQALAAKRDVWGELALHRPGGPSYAFFEKLLPPLRYVDCISRQYPIVLSAPLAGHKARLISDGSAVNPSCGSVVTASHWHAFPVGATFHVGAKGEVYGSDPSRLSGPTYESGYLPVVRTKYDCDGATLAEEAFVPVEPPYSDHAATFVRFSLAGEKTLEVRVTVEAKDTPALRGPMLLDSAGRALLWLSDRWRWDGRAKELTATLDSKTPLILAVFSEPLADPHLPGLDEAVYEDARSGCTAEWQRWIDRCATFDLPEQIVSRAWKSVVIGDLMIAVGDRMFYSAGNVYQDLWVSENGDAVRSLLSLGLLDQAKRMTRPLLGVSQKGVDFHNAAFKLQLVAQVYWLTRDADFVRNNRDLWQPAADLILNSREKTTGLLPRENYCGDITTQVYSLNSEANGWRGLRDIAAVLRDIGQPEPAARIAGEAAGFRKAVILALDKSVARDARPDFIPVALFGAEQPYDTLTATVNGTYWCLMIPYVLQSGILGEAQTQAAMRYLQTHGGLCMGMIRIHQHSGLFANENGVDDLYTLRYTQSLLQRDDVDRALVGFYGKLAQGFTADTFEGAEGTSLIPLDPRGRPMYLPPNAGSNAFFLQTLRELLVQDYYVDGDGTPDSLRLLFATPRAWLEDGKTIRISNAPTAFGPVSVVARSDLSHGQVTVEITPPPRGTKSTRLRVRLPEGWGVASASIADVPLNPEAANPAVGATFDVTSQHRPFTLNVRVERK